MPWQTCNNQLRYTIGCFSAQIFSQSKQQEKSETTPFSLQIILKAIHRIKLLENTCFNIFGYNASEVENFVGLLITWLKKSANSG